MPRFSVVIPTLRRRELVQQSVASVLGQTLPPHEVIVVIDAKPGEDDGTEEALSERFPQVRVLRTGGKGDAVARQVGIEAATGDWVCFLDDDDLWHRDKLALTAEHIAQHPGCGAVRGTVWLFATDPAAPDGLFGLRRDFVAADLDECHAHAAESPPVNDFSYLDIHGRSLELMLERNRGIVHTSAVRRDLMLAARPVPPGLLAGVDWVMLTEVAALTEWCFVDRGMAFYRLHAGQFSHDPRIARATAQAMRVQWERHGDLAPRPLETYAGEYRPRLREMAWATARARRWADTRDILRTARALLPRRRDRLGVLVHPGVAARWTALRARAAG